MTAAVTILLVDEEPILQRATALMLTDRGARVSAVASIGEAIALTERCIFDVAVIDLPPRGPSPAEIVEQLRAHGTLPRRLVVCSCAPLDRDEAQLFSAILPKPYPFERLLTAVFGAHTLRRPSCSGVSPRLRAEGVSRLARTKDAPFGAHGPAPQPLPIAKDTWLAEVAEETTAVADLTVSGRAPRARGRLRVAEAARVVATDPRRASATSFRGTRRAARARRDRG